MRRAQQKGGVAATGTLSLKRSLAPAPRLHQPSRLPHPRRAKPSAPRGPQRAQDSVWDGNGPARHDVVLLLRVAHAVHELHLPLCMTCVCTHDRPPRQAERMGAHSSPSVSAWRVAGGRRWHSRHSRAFWSPFCASASMVAFAALKVSMRPATKAFLSSGLPIATQRGGVASGDVGRWRPRQSTGHRAEMAVRRRVVCDVRRTRAF